MTNQLLRPPASSHRSPRANLKVSVVGAQGADLPVLLTNSRVFTYTGSAADSGQDISSFYKKFIIQTSPTNARDVTVQVRANSGSAWVSAPTSLMSDTGAITPGNIRFVTLPAAGVSVRLLVSQPVGSTDFSIVVLMDDCYDRTDVGRS